VISLNKSMLLFGLLIACLLAGCTKNTSVPENVSPKFYSQSVEVVKILEKHMKDVGELTKQEQQKVDIFFTMKPMTTKESDIQGHINILEASRSVNYLSANSNDSNARITSVKMYMEELNQLKELLNISTE
jgi:hypothetical protein